MYLKFSRDKPTLSHNRRVAPAAYQKGSMMVTSIFIIVGLMAMGLSLINIISGAAKSHAIEYYGARAYMAAESGLERSLSLLFPRDAGVQNCGVVPTTMTFSADYLKFCNLNISCTMIGPVTTDTGSVNVYRVNSTATCNNIDCPSGSAGDACRVNQWQTQRSLEVEAKTLQ